MKQKAIQNCKSPGKTIPRRCTEFAAATTLLVGMLLLAYWTWVRIQSGQSPGTHLPMNKNLVVLFVSSYFASMLLLDGRPGFATGVRQSGRGTMGLLTLGEMLDRWIRKRTMAGHVQHRNLFVFSAIFCCGMLAFGASLGMAAVNASIQGGFPVLWLLLILPFSAFPWVWHGAKCARKFTLWSKKETREAVSRDRLREARRKLGNSISGAPYVIFLIGLGAPFFWLSRSSDEGPAASALIATMIGIACGGFVFHLLRLKPCGWPASISMVLLATFAGMGYLHHSYAESFSPAIPLLGGFVWGMVFGVAMAATYLNERRREQFRKRAHRKSARPGIKTRGNEEF